MQAEMLDLDVVSIVVACGGSVLDPRSLKNYGDGKFENVITNMEFERLVSASGPTEGEIIGFEGLETPKRITFVLCAGSRDVNFQGYCSRVCCMNSIKEALLAKEHLKDTEITLLYMDIRSFGKGFEEYYNRAKEMGIKFVRGKAADITKEKSHLVVRVENTEEGKIEDMETDMVVLTPPLLPADHIGDLAKVLDIKLDDNGFFKSEQVRYSCAGSQPVRRTSRILLPKLQVLPVAHCLTLMSGNILSWTSLRKVEKGNRGSASSSVIAVTISPVLWT
jgi:heterodisulfide reductase subunit A